MVSSTSLGPLQPQWHDMLQAEVPRRQAFLGTAKSLLELKSIELRAGEEYHRSGIYLIIYIYIYLYTYIYYQVILYICIYIYRLKAGGSPELRGTLSLDAIPERSFLYTDGGVGGVGGGVITSCEVRWMMLNPGRCCLAGRCCYVASFVVV